MKRALSILLIVSVTASAYCQDYIKNGNNCYDSSNWVCASENYKAALRENSYKQQDYGVILHRIGYAQLKLKNFSEAESFLLRSIAADAGYKYPYWDLGAVYYNLEKYDKAAEYYGKAIPFYSDERSLNSLYYWRGRCYSLNENYLRAIDDLRIALSYNQNDKDALWELGDAFYNFSSYDSAVYYYRKAIPFYESSKEDQSFLYYWVGQAKYKQENFREAAAEYKKGYELNPTNKYIVSSIGDAYYGLNEFSTAYDWYNRSIELYLKERDSVALSSLYYFMGFCNFKLGNYQKALPDFERSIVFNQKNASRYAGLADCQRMLKNYDQALANYSRALEVQNISGTDKALYLYWRGKTYQLQNKIDDAGRDWEESYRLTTKWIDVSRELAEYYWTKRDLVKSEQHYVRVVNSPLFRDSTALLLEAYSRLGSINHSNGHFSDAIANFSEAIKYSTNDNRIQLAELYFERGRAYVQLNDKTHAIADLNKAIELDTRNKAARDLLKTINR